MQPAPPVPTTTYRELARRVRTWQAGLDGLGIGAGERVAVVSHNSARLMELLHAVPASGRIKQGYLSISDRKKDVILTGGENVSSIEVEDCVFGHPGVAEVAVIGVPSQRWGETIKALVVRGEGAEVTEAEIIAHCKQRLAGYKAPTSVEFRDEIRRTATGKIQKFKLREPYWQGRDRSVN